MHAPPDDAVCIHKDVRSRATMAIHFATFVGSEDEVGEIANLFSLPAIRGNRGIVLNSACHFACVGNIPDHATRSGVQRSWNTKSNWKWWLWCLRHRRDLDTACEWATYHLNKEIRTESVQVDRFPEVAVVSSVC